jgi:hypothetical protein
MKQEEKKNYNRIKMGGCYMRSKKAKIRGGYKNNELVGNKWTSE